MSESHHEALAREEETRPGSDRVFGLVFAAVFLIVAGWPMLNGKGPALWALALAVLLAALAVAAPRVLHPLNIAWLKFGLLLARIVSPIALALLYFGAFLPTGLLMRLFGKDPLRRRLEPEAKSYWIERPAGEGARSDMRNQF